MRLSERRSGENLVIAAAHDRPKLYGGFTQRAYQQYGKQAELIPLAEQFQEFSTDFKYLSRDDDTISRIRAAASVFFVGGEPQRLSKVLIGRDGNPTELAGAVQQAYREGSLIVGGIPGRAIVSTLADPLHALQEGELGDDDYASGLDLLANDWYIDQHYFGRGRFATSLVAMHQFGMQFGVGVGLDTAAVIHGSAVEVLGNRGVVTVDLVNSTFEMTKKGLRIRNVRLNYLENGDRMDMKTGSVTAHSSKINGFELNASSTTTSKEPLASSREMLRPGELVRLMSEALDSNSGQAVGYALHHDSDESGFKFRFFTRESSRGWLSVDDDQERMSLENIYLDIDPI